MNPAIRCGLVAVIGVLFMAAADSTPPDTAAATATAAEAIARFRQELGRTLRKAMTEDGPEHAIEVCRVDAPNIARKLTTESVSMGRTSHRLRNPDNAPEAWMEPLLSDFQQSDPLPGSSRSVDLGPRGVGYVEPIYLQPLCVTCHGKNVEPGLLARIRERYPDDEAVDFAVGDFRGLFWAVVADAPDPLDVDR